MMLPLLHWCGKITTRVLLCKALRPLPGIPRLYTALYLFGKRISDSHEIALLRRQVSPGMRIADIGANVGFYTTMLASFVGVSGHVYAFEPDPFTRGILERRIKKFPNTSVIPLALSDVEGQSTLVCNPANRANNALENGTQSPLAGERIPVQTTTFDRWWLSQGSPNIRLVKMDTEGWELRILRGMEQFIAATEHLTIFLEYNPRLLRQAGEDPVHLLDWLTQRNFSVTMAHGPSLAPIEDAAAMTQSLGNGFRNLLAIRQRPSQTPPGTEQAPRS